MNDISQKDEKNSSPCWIALVQRYNFAHQVLKRGESVQKTSEGDLVSDVDQIKEVLSIDDDLAQLVTVGRPTGSEEASAIDFSTVQHVQCCGHQVFIAHTLLEIFRNFFYSLFGLGTISRFFDFGISLLDIGFTHITHLYDLLIDG